MDDGSWHEARLIPTSGIESAQEQEHRATCALLAVLGTVEEFARAVTEPLGAPAGTVQAFAPVAFRRSGVEVTAAGVLRVRRGRRDWTTLVEVRTGGGTLDATRLQTLLRVVEDESLDALLTISNEVPSVPGRHPSSSGGAPLADARLHHRTWSQVLSEVVLQRQLRATDDPGRAWVLGELVRYLEHPRSGALEFSGMGDSWGGVLDAVGDGTLQPGDRGVDEATSRFDALLRYASLRLGRRLGSHVVPGLSRRELAEPEVRGRALRESLTGSGVLQGSIRIPEAVGALVITADLREGNISCHVDVDAPRDGRPATRVRWMVRQLHAAPGEARVETFVARSGGAHAAEPLAAVRESPLILVTEPGRDLRGFRVSVDRPLVVGPGRGPDSFADGVLAAVEDFHRDVLVGLTAWTANPSRPRIDDAVPPVDVPTEPDIWIDIRRDPESDSLRPTPSAAAVGPSEGTAPEPPGPVRASVRVLAPSPVHVVVAPKRANVPLPSRRELRAARAAAALLEPRPPEGTASGWRPDPVAGGGERWWDGDVWSERTRPTAREGAR